MARQNKDVFGFDELEKRSNVLKKLSRTRQMHF